MAKQLSEWEKLGGDKLPRIPKVDAMPAPDSSLDYRLDELLKDIPPITKPEFAPPEGSKRLGKRALEKARKDWEEQQRQDALNKALGREACEHCAPPESKEDRRKRIEALLSADFSEPIEPLQAPDPNDESAIASCLQDTDALLKDFENLGLGLPHAS